MDWLGAKNINAEGLRFEVDTRRRRAGNEIMRPTVYEALCSRPIALSALDGSSLEDNVVETSGTYDIC
jgi:hypothetical protein